MKLAFTLFLVALMILPAVTVAGYRFRRALRKRDEASSHAESSDD